MNNHSYSKVIAFSSIFGALALMISLSGLATVFSYPLAPFLKFDISEVVDVVALFLGGYLVGFITTFIHMLGLFVMGVDVPIGPPLKFLAIISMFPGFYIGKILRNKMGTSAYKSNLVGYFMAVNFRWIVMTIVNAVVLLYLVPYYLTFFIPQSSGNISDINVFLANKELVFKALMTALGIIASYNVFHGIFTIVVSVAIYNIIKRTLNI